MKKYYLFFILFCVFNTSCSKKEISKIKISKNFSLNNNIIIDDYCYSSVFIYDSLLILISECDSTFFHIYDKNSLSLLKKFGTKGRGPNEFDFPFPFKSNTVFNSDVYSFFDLNLPRKTGINFKKYLQNKDLTDCIVTETIDKQLFSSNELNSLSGKVIGQSLNLSEGLFFIYDTESKRKKWVKYVPKIKLKTRYRKEAYSGSLCSNENMIVYASKYIDEILFFDPNGTLIKDYYFSDIKKPLLSKNFSGVDQNSILYNIDSYATNKNCYILRVNQPIINLRNSLNYQTQLLIFDWESNHTSTFQLETVPLCFCVDESTSVLYSIVMDDYSSGKVKIVKNSLLD